jgi:large subunit ribosomal protein L25
MERVQLEGTVRKELGKGPSRRLRRDGLIPAVVYGPRMIPMPVALNPKEMKRILSAGENLLVDLRIGGGQEVQTRLVMVKDYNFHPVTERLWHVDLYEISLKETIKVDVPLAFVGESVAVSRGGVLSPLIRALEVSCLPERIPNQIEVDCSSLKMGETLHVADLQIPPEIQVLNDTTTAVVTVLEPASEVTRVESKEEAPPEEAPET